jgi:hypothetical protein
MLQLLHALFDFVSLLDHIGALTHMSAFVSNDAE